MKYSSFRNSRYIKYIGIYFFAFSSLFVFHVNALQVASDTNCTLCFDTNNCFSSETSINVVRENVTRMDEKFRFCLEQIDWHKASPIKVILVVDRSGSMCDGVIGNDPTDMRIKAANNFVDSLKLLSPESYVGVITFADRIRSSLKPVKLTDLIMLDSLRLSIEQGACNPNTSLTLAKVTATNQGIALDSALKMMEELNTKTPNSIRQHILLLTDDGWYESRDILPDSLIAKHRSLFHNGILPQIHTTLLTFAGKPQANGILGMENLKKIADLTGGQFIEDGTPENIVQKFMQIFRSIIGQGTWVLKEISFQNLKTNEEHILSHRFVTPENQTQVIATGPGWALQDGINLFGITNSFLIGNDSVIRVSDTFRVDRKEIENCILSTNMYLACVTTPVSIKNQKSGNTTDRASTDKSTSDNQIWVTILSNTLTKTSGFAPAVKAVYCNVLKHFQTNGILVSVSSSIRLTPLSDGSYGTADVYNILGNKIGKRIPIFGTGVESRINFADQSHALFFC